MRHRILIVDDHLDAAAVSCMFVEALGHAAVACTTGASGLEQAIALQPDVALLDIGLPDISGYELARRLREMFAAKIFLAAITGWGFDHHVLKPASGDVIKAIFVAAAQTLRARA